MTRDQLVLIKEQMEHCAKQEVRWEKFLAYERAGTRSPAHCYGISNLQKTIGQWKARKEALQAAVSELERTVVEA